MISGNIFTFSIIFFVWQREGITPSSVSTWVKYSPARKLFCYQSVAFRELHPVMRCDIPYA